MENPDYKKEIARRFVIAVDYLMDTGVIDSYKDLGKVDIRPQRVSDFKKYVSDDERNSYVSAVEVKLLHEHFGISYAFVMDGVKPIRPESETTHETRADHMVSDNPQPRASYGKTAIEDRMDIIEKQHEILKMEIELLRKMSG